MAERNLHIGVIGAGLGGLTAAIGIARSGHKVTILEQASVLAEVPLHQYYSIARADIETGRRRHTNSPKLIQDPQALWPSSGNRGCVCKTK